MVLNPLNVQTVLASASSSPSEFALRRSSSESSYECCTALVGLLLLGMREVFNLGLVNWSVRFVSCLNCQNIKEMFIFLKINQIVVELLNLGINLDFLILVLFNLINNLFLLILFFFNIFNNSLYLFFVIFHQFFEPLHIFFLELLGLIKLFLFHSDVLFESFVFFLLLINTYLAH